MNMVHRTTKTLLPLLMLFLIASAVYADEDDIDPADLNITVDPQAEPLDLCSYAESYEYQKSVILIDGQPCEMWRRDHSEFSLNFKAKAKGPGEGKVLLDLIDSYGKTARHVEIPVHFIFKPDEEDIWETLAHQNSDGNVIYDKKWRNPVERWELWMHHSYDEMFGKDFYSERRDEYGNVKLIEGKDYEYIKKEFTGGKNVGPAKAVYTLAFKGDFEGTITKTIKYKVVPKTPTVKSGKAGKGKVTIKIAKQTAQTDGFKVVIRDRDKRDRIVKTKVFKSNKKTKFVIKGLKKGHWCDGYVYAYKTVKGKKYWSWEGYTKGVMVIK